MFDVSHTDVPGTRRFLNVMLVLAVIDLILLVPLFLGLIGVLDTDSYVSVVGMTHGLLFIALVLLGGFGALRGRWNWKYPIATVLAGLIGLVVIPDLLIRRELEAGETAAR
jgi:ABC-type antimicrobial peptide transport system permease subunit